MGEGAATAPGLHSHLLAGHARSRLLRIDLSREGDWPAHLCTIWSAASGDRGLAGATPWHPSLRPALELYYEAGWIGLPCGRRERGGWGLDEELVRQLVAWATAPDPGGS